MRHRLSLSLALVACLLALPFVADTRAARAEDAPPDDHPLSQLAFLVGTFEGQGTLPNGATYDETFTGAWILGGTALEIRSTSRVGGQVVFEDRRIVSVDATLKRPFGMRQWSGDRLRVYRGWKGESAFVFAEGSQETGPGVRPEPAWRYTFTPKTGNGFDYTVHTVVDGTAKPFVSGSLAPHLKDPGKAGGLGLRQYDAEIAGMSAQVHHPDGPGPYPLIVFSPGGGAESPEGYRPYGRWFATWGYVTLIIAFNDKDATERAAKFGKAIDWALAENARDGSPLHRMLDPERIAAAGHSRGAYAALVAGARDARIDAVLALAPSGPSEGDADAHAPAACVIIGTEDDFRGAAQKAYALQRGERFHVEIEGMEHMLTPREQVLKLVRRSTCFLEYALKGDTRYRAPLVEGAEGVKVSAEPAAKRK